MLGSVEPSGAATATEVANILWHDGTMRQQRIISSGGLRKLCEEGRLEDAVQTVNILYRQGICVSKIFYCLLQGCINKKDLKVGRLVNLLLMRSPYMVDSFLGSHLIRMFALCGSLSEANEVFRKLHHPNIYAWSSVIFAHVKHGQGEQAVELYQEFKQSGFQPDEHIFVAVLQGSVNAGGLTQAKMIHADIVESGLEGNVFVGGTLLHVYIKSGSLGNARRVFDKLSTQDIVTWSSIIAGYAQHGHSQEALWLFEKMQEEGTNPNKVTLVNILKASSGLGNLNQGKLIHTVIVEHGCECDLIVGNALVDMYCKCGSLEDARNIFDTLPKIDVATWSAMIAGYAIHKPGQGGFLLFCHMQSEDFKPNCITFASVLNMCSSMAALSEGKFMHADITEEGNEVDECIGNALVDMYTKCGSLKDAGHVFDNLPSRNVVAWNAMIGGYAVHHDYKLAIQVFGKMQEEGIKPDNVTFISLLSGCSHMGLVDEGFYQFKVMKEIYGIKPRLEHYNCLVDLLGRAGLLDEAEDLLHVLSPQANIVGWLSLLTNSKIYGNVDLARRCFDKVVMMDCRYASGFALMSNIYT